MSGPFKMKGSPMKRNFGIGTSPTKHTEEESGFSHQHPHTEKQEKIAKQRKKGAAREIREGSTSSVVPSETKELKKMGTEWEKSTRKRWEEES